MFLAFFVIRDDFIQAKFPEQWGITFACCNSYFSSTFDTVYHRCLVKKAARGKGQPFIFSANRRISNIECRSAEGAAGGVGRFKYLVLDHGFAQFDS